MDKTKEVEDLMAHTQEIFFIFGKQDGEPITYMKKMAKFRDDTIEGLKDKIHKEMHGIGYTDIPINAREDFIIYHGPTEMPSAVYAAMLQTHKYLPETRVKVYKLEQFLEFVETFKESEDVEMTSWQARCVFNAMFDEWKNDINHELMSNYMEMFQDNPEQFNQPVDLDECFERFKVPGEICQTYDEREGKHWEVTEEAFRYFHEVMMPMAMGWVKEHTRYAYIMSECLTGHLYDKFVETKEDGPSRFYYECVDIRKDPDFKILDPEYFYKECGECGDKYPDDKMNNTDPDTHDPICDDCFVFMNDDEEEDY